MQSHFPFQTTFLEAVAGTFLRGPNLLCIKPFWVLLPRFPYFIPARITARPSNPTTSLSPESAFRLDNPQPTTPRPGKTARSKTELTPAGIQPETPSQLTGVHPPTAAPPTLVAASPSPGLGSDGGNGPPLLAYGQGQGRLDAR
jgi:hypothetical protein